MQIYLNGQIVPQEEARVSVFDHGFLYGDGVFEGIRVYDGNVFRLKEHIDRLYESAKCIALEIPLAREEMTQATLATIAVNEKRDAYIRLVVSRGPGDLGIDPSKCSTPTVVIIVTSIALYPPEFYEKGISIVTTSVRRIPSQCLDPRIKSLNYMNNILAIIEAKKAGAPEGLMLNLQGRVAECTADNIFIVKNGRLKTPPELEGALGGITRNAVIDMARNADIPYTESRLGLHDLYNADECFLTGTGAEVMPVSSVDGRQIGNGEPGKTTKRLLAALGDLRVKDGVMVEYPAGVTAGKR
jgi:branched-chain amino acid aminotransferase